MVIRASLAGHLALTVLAVAAVYWIGPGLGFVLTLRAAAILALGAIAVELAPRWAKELTLATGLFLLGWYHPVHAFHTTLLVAALYLCRDRGWALVATVGLGALALPKMLFSRFYHQPHWYDWLNEPHLAVVIFAIALWWRETKARGLTESPPLTDWGLLFFFPTHALNPIVLGPGDLWRNRKVDAGAVLGGVALFAAKAAALAASRHLFPNHGFSESPAQRLLALSPAHLWLVVALNYLDLVLVLSGTADIAIALARLYGWNLPSPFRWALLAWNPVELWRRWGLYNRRFLLKTVYFPLGGAKRHRLLNVMLTFLASALVLHTGWFGSKYWEVGVAGWRDQTIYFLLQGAAVCACLVFWGLRGREAGADRTLRWSFLRGLSTLGTQAFSALIHVVILAQVVPLTDRWRLIGRCLGLR